MPKRRKWTRREKSLFAAPLLLVLFGAGAWLWPRESRVNIGLADVTDINALSFSPDSKRLAVSVGYEGRVPIPIQIFDVESQRKICDLATTIAYTGAVSWSPDGKRVAASYYDGTMGRTPIPDLSGDNGTPLGFNLNRVGKFTVWDAQNGYVLGQHFCGPINEDTSCYPLQFSSDGGKLISNGKPPAMFDIGTQKRVRVFSREPIAQVNAELGLVAQIESVSSRVQIIDVKSKRKIWQSRPRKSTGNIFPVLQWNGAVLSVCTKNLRSSEQTAFSDTDWLLWDGKTRSLISNPFCKRMSFPAFSGDGRTLGFVDTRYVSPTPYTRGDTKREIVAWDYHSHRTLWRHAVSFNTLKVDWSPNGKWLSIITENAKEGQLHLYIYNRRGQLKTQQKIDGYLALWSPDSQQIAIASSRRVSNQHIQLIKMRD